MKKMNRFYFQTKQQRQRAYNLLANHNFFWSYDKNISMRIDQDLTDYMLELLEYEGFDVSSIFVLRH